MRNILYYRGITVLLLLFSVHVLNGQNRDGNFNFGIHYSYAGISDEIGVSSGTGIELFKALSPRVSIGLKSAWFFPVGHEISGSFTESNYNTKMFAVSTMGRFDMMQTGKSSTYFLFGINYHLTTNRGEITFFNDVAPYDVITRTIDTRKHSGSPLIGGGFEISRLLHFYIEPLVVFIPSANLIISTGIRMPL